MNTFDEEQKMMKQMLKAGLIMPAVTKTHQYEQDDILSRNVFDIGPKKLRKVFKELMKYQYTKPRIKHLLSIFLDNKCLMDKTALCNDGSYLSAYVLIRPTYGYEILFLYGEDTHIFIYDEMEILHILANNCEKIFVNISLTTKAEMDTYGAFRMYSPSYDEDFYKVQSLYYNEILRPYVGKPPYDPFSIHRIHLIEDPKLIMKNEFAYNKMVCTDTKKRYCSVISLDEK